MGWIDNKLRRPDSDGLYKVKVSGCFSKVRQAYYEVITSSWIHDDGSWLPVDIGLYVTHWKDEG